MSNACDRLPDAVAAYILATSIQGYHLDRTIIRRLFEELKKNTGACLHRYSKYLFGFALGQGL
jgi:hypothetical protein